MEYNTQKELYLTLLPVFRVKRRLMSRTKYPNTSDGEIWQYLTIKKWKNSINLTISDMVNDIIMADVEDINNFIGGKNEKR